MTEKNLNKKSNRDDNNILRLKNISKIYPGTIALNNLNIDIAKGKVHGIIGKNGAGKSTLVGIIAGIISPTEGEICIGNKIFKSFSRADAKNEKISIVTQESEVIADCTVAENLFLPDYICRGRLIIDWKKLYSEAQKIVEKDPLLNINVKTKVRDLSLSERQILLILKACYVEDADIIIMDEVSTALSQEDDKQLYRIVEERKKAGKTIIFISHRMEEILRICEEVSVIRNGELVSKEICSHLDEKKLSHLIVGEDFHFDKFKKTEEEVKICKGKTQEIVLSVENLSNYVMYDNISFHLKKGEILGFAGLRGSGKTEIFKGIVGIDPAVDGWIIIEGEKKKLTHPTQAFENHIVYLPEERDEEGLIKTLSMKKNLVINVLRKITNGILINKKKENEIVSSLVDMLQIQAASPEQEVSQLSGGNKQKVVVGKILATKPKVYLLDEPTKGIDIAAKESILWLIKNKLSKSSSIIVTSPELKDLMLICDRILALYKGEIVAEFPREEFKEKDIFLAIQGAVKT